MYQRILIPLDESELAQAVLPYVVELAKTTMSEITLLRVCEEHENCTDLLHKNYLEYITKGLSQQLGSNNNVINAYIKRGHPAKTILNYAEQNNIDLIAISTHGRSGLDRWLMGSVASKILSASITPVLLINPGTIEKTPPADWLKHNILAPLDGSSTAEGIIPHISYLANKQGMEIILLRVCETPLIPAIRSQAIEPYWEEYRDQIINECKSQAVEYLNAMGDSLRKQGLKITTENIMGDTAEEIINYISGNNIGLIALTTHGRSGITRWTYGSVANKLLSSISIPTLLINARTYKA